jgi:DNA-damage-inducible protein D
MDSVMERLDAAKRLSRNGGEYWMGRDLQPLLGYDKWENFRNVIQKAIEACKSAGVETKYHFLNTGKVITAGKGAQLERED